MPCSLDILVLLMIFKLLHPPSGNKRDCRRRVCAYYYCYFLSGSLRHALHAVLVVYSVALDVVVRRSDDLFREGNFC